MSELPKYVIDLLQKIAKSEGFVDGLTIEAKPGCSAGDGFLGIIASVTISGRRCCDNTGSDKDDDRLYLVCKLAPENAARREAFDSIKLFKREAFMYGHILPILANFEREKGLTDMERFTSYPKCYEIIENDETDQFVIVMEDLKASGHTMWTRSKPIPINYANTLMEQLARLHAISFAIKDQRPAIYAKFKEITDLVCDFTRTSTMQEIITKSYARCLAAVEHPKHIEIMKDMAANSQMYYDEIVKEDFYEPYGVVSHGDCWINNLMIRSNGEHEQPSISLIDWQMSRFGSLILDLHYIMFTSISREVLQTDYQNIMDHYYAALAEQIRKLGSDPDQLYPYNTFKTDLKKFSKLAFIMGLVMAQLLVANSDNLSDLDEISEKTGGSADFIQNIDEETRSEYNLKVRNLLDSLIELDFYWN